jgi:hypothetical protein
MNRILATLLAGCFAVGAYAQQGPAHAPAGSGMSSMHMSHPHAVKAKKHHTAAKKGKHHAKHAKKHSKHAQRV